MRDCLDCIHIAPLEPLPKGSPLRIQRGQWGMLARRLAYCRLDKGDTAIIHALGCGTCPRFELEPDEKRRAAKSAACRTSSGSCLMRTRRMIPT